MKKYVSMIAASASLIVNSTPSGAAESEFAKQLSNLLASPILVPFQLNHDTGYVSDDGTQTTQNIQPAILFSLNPDLNRSIRTVVLFKWQTEVINSTYLQPFITFTTSDTWISSTNSESTHDWNERQWIVSTERSRFEFLE